MAEQEPIRLDVEKVVHEKMQGKHVPRLLVHWLRHIVHEDIFNRFFREHPDLTDYDFIREVIGPHMLNATVEIEGLENIPPTGKPLFFVSNHPLGGLDGMIEALMLGEYRGKRLRVIVNELLMNLRPLQGIFVPVSVGSSRQSKETTATLDELYASDHDILTFPSGKCYRIIDGKLQDPEWKKSFLRKAVQYQRDVVPIFFEGQNSRFFYRLALWRTRLGIKQNIEMLFLSDEMFKATGKHFRVRVGKPIPWQTFNSSHTTAEWVEYVREQCYGLMKNEE